MIQQFLTEEMKTALRSKNSFKLGVIRYLLSQIKNKEIELKASGESLTDEVVLSVLKKQIKKHNQSIESYKQGNRDDLVETELKELEIVQSYYDKFSLEA